MLVELCIGGCIFGGILSWGEFKWLVEFVFDSLFYGLVLCDDVIVLV